MKLIIVKTNIPNRQKALSVGYILTISPHIKDWSVDLEDRDRILRMEVSDHVQEQDVINLVQDLGHRCESIPD